MIAEVRKPSFQRPIALLATLGVAWFAGPLVAPAPVTAQAHRIDNPVGSYLWWTLSEHITPEELKLLYSDRALSLERYQQALDAGLEQPLTDDQLNRLTFYINHELTPELAPMWWAFDIFARDWLVPKQQEEVLVTDLSRYRISRSGIDKILVAAHGCAADHEALMSDLGPKQIEAQLLIADRLRLERKRGFVGKPILESVNERQYDVVARVAGKDVDEIRELVDALADWEAGRRLVAACLPELEQQLLEPDWQRFRDYLREQVIAPLGGLSFFEPAIEEDER